MGYSQTGASRNKFQVFVLIGLTDEYPTEATRTNHAAPAELLDVPTGLRVSRLRDKLNFSGFAVVADAVARLDFLS
jgi:hypothetical protein